MNTALAVIPQQAPLLEREVLALRIVESVKVLCAKLREFEDDIRLLWIEFDNLKAGETILGCATKKEFCEKRLHRSPRAIQYLLYGRIASESEHCSLPSLGESLAIQHRQLVEVAASQLRTELMLGALLIELSRGNDVTDHTYEDFLKEHEITPSQAFRFMKMAWKTAKLLKVKSIIQLPLTLDELPEDEGAA